MNQPIQLNDNEKKLLTVLGRHPELPLQELINYTGYTLASSITRKIKQFKKENMIIGPTYSVDYGKLCKNSIRQLFCIIELENAYSTVIDYLKLIEPLVWVYPVLSSHKKLLMAGFLSSNNKKMISLFNLLKDAKIITDFIVHVRRYKIIIENPDFFGDPVPSLDDLLTPCEFPDISFGHHHTVWSDCDITTLSYLQGGYERVALTDILKKEEKLNMNRTYEQIKYSYKKITKNKLITKMYYIHPYPLEQCADFYLFLQIDEREIIQQLLGNFARGGRIHREYTLLDEGGMMGCICHPQFVLTLMHKLDSIDEIKKKELYHIRSFSQGVLYTGAYGEFKYYNVNKQTLEYPYHLFENSIKEKLEKE